MIPNSNILTDRLTERQFANKTYCIKISGGDADRLVGFTDGLDAVKQAVYLILNTERFKSPLYSWDYGVELIDLIGQPIPYVMSEVPRRIDEALTQDDRIVKTENYEFEKNGIGLKVSFTVVTNVGEFQAELDVNNFANNFTHVEPEQKPDVPTPDEPSDPSEPSDHDCPFAEGAIAETREHRHAEMVTAGMTFVYCNGVAEPCKIGDITYLPWSMYPG